MNTLINNFKNSILPDPIWRYFHEDFQEPAGYARCDLCLSNKYRLKAISPYLAVQTKGLNDHLRISHPLIQQRCKNEKTA